ncbi:MAG: Holliday junction resolvase RuvX [Candidatus Latescibacterota bacterium]|nr:MAG: Holliday junction resolvase RuvX [Candidatus Latescibacterota bacterium]
MRILGIDHGERRVGFAVSDELGITAQGLETFDRKSGDDLVDFTKRLVEEYDVAEIVIGYPIGLSGGEGASGVMARELADVLQERLSVKVTLWDERFSSEEAKRVLRGHRAAKSAVDKIAAVIILQSYLDYLGRSR